MQRQKAIAVLAVLIAASAIMTAVAIDSSTYTWEETFEVKKPEITAKIKIGDCRIVGCPVKISVSLRVQAPCEENRSNCCDHDRKHCSESICSINGTYTADLLWLNTTDDQWQNLKVLQPETNMTITCRWCTNVYFFTPTEEGQYKVVVTFTTDSETQTFTNED